MSFSIFEPTQDHFKISLEEEKRQPEKRRSSSSCVISYDNLYANDWTTDEKPSSSAAELLALLATKIDDTPCVNRDPRNGAWTFAPNSEYDLVMHVQGLLQAHQSRLELLTPVETAEAVLRAVDVYCLGKQWMYHIGAPKGEVVAKFLHCCLKHQHTAPPVAIVDVGTYCGYSAILLAKTVLKQAPHLSLRFKVYTLESNPKFARVAQAMITMAQMEEHIQVITYDPTAPRALSRTLQQHLPRRKIDYLLLDHDKDRYLPDLQQLEQERWLGTGSYVAADNVIVARQLQSYRLYMAQKQAKGLVQTQMLEQQLEYSDQNDASLRDGIELTVYL